MAAPTLTPTCTASSCKHKPEAGERGTSFVDPVTHEPRWICAGCTADRNALIARDPGFC